VRAAVVRESSTRANVPRRTLVFAAIALVSDSIWAFAAGGFRAWFASSPRRLELIGGAGGLAIVAVGAGPIVSGRKD
jgi:threonine/homoserine/homoserine lactone efflux protein